MSDVDHGYILRTCILCSAGSLQRVLPPPTAGLRILSLDGGGTWGRLSLEILSVLQGIVGPSVPIQDLFDIVYGTSVGES